MMPAMSLDDCSGPNLKCWIQNCRFSTITQKGLTIHLQTVHGIEIRERSRPLKGARSRRKNAAPRDFLADPSWGRPFVCLICQIGYASKEELTRHSKQAHNCGQNCGSRPGIPVNSPGNPGGSGRPRGRAPLRPEAPYSYYRFQPDPQCNRAVRPMYDQYCVDQAQMRSDDFHEQGSAMVQEPAPQDDQYDRSNMYDAQRAQQEWSGYRTSVQTPQAMSAEFASTIQSRGDESANNWIPQVTTQRIDDANVQLWSNVGQMQSFQYDLKKDSENVSQGIGGETVPCTQCGCASRGGCTQRADGLVDVNRIILVEQETGGAQTSGENHEVYHLQACSSLGNFKASNVKQVVNQGDVIVLECHTEDGREVVLKALRAGPETDETEERNDGNDGLTLALASSPMNGSGVESTSDALESGNFNEDPALPEQEPQSSASIEQPAEESMQTTLPQLFPELFEDCLVGSENKSMSWPADETEESDNFLEVCKKSDYLTALSHCRGVRDDSGSLLLKCCRCEYCTDVGDPLEQLQIHIRKHMETSFQCRRCEFNALLREEMLVHVGTQHDVAQAELTY